MVHIRGINRVFRVNKHVENPMAGKAIHGGHKPITPKDQARAMTSENYAACTLALLEQVDANCNFTTRFELPAN